MKTSTTKATRPGKHPDCPVRDQERITAWLNPRSGIKTQYNRSTPITNSVWLKYEKRRLAALGVKTRIVRFQGQVTLAHDNGGKR